MAEIGCKAPYVDPALSFQNLVTRSFEAICSIAASETLIENKLEPASCGHWEVNAPGNPGANVRADFNHICHGSGLDENGDTLTPEEMEQLLISQTMQKMGAANFPKQVTTLFGGLRNVAAAANEFTRIASETRNRISHAKDVVNACATDPWERRARIVLGVLPGVWSPHDAKEAIATTNEEREAMLYSFYMIKGVKECFKEKFREPLRKRDDGVEKFLSCIAPANVIEKTDEHGNTITYYVVDTDMAKIADSAVKLSEFPISTREEMYVVSVMDAAGRASGDQHFVLALLADYYLNLSQSTSDDKVRRRHLEHARKFLNLVSEQYLDDDQKEIGRLLGERLARLSSAPRRMINCDPGAVPNDMGTGCVDTEESCSLKGTRLMRMLDTCEPLPEEKSPTPTEAMVPAPASPAGVPEPTPDT